MRGIYNIFINNDIDIAVSVIKSEHLKLYKKLGVELASPNFKFEESPE